MPSAIEKLLMRLRDRYADSGLATFLSWWRSELVGCLPKQWRERFAKQPPTLQIQRREQGWLLTRSRGPVVEGSLLVPFDEAARDNSPAQIRALRHAGESPVQRLVYRLPAALTLARKIQLPLAAEDNLERVVAFEMDKHTPFKAEQVYSAVRIRKRDSTARLLTVDLVVVPKPALNAELDALATLHLNPDVVDIDRTDFAVEQNLLPSARRQSNSNPQRRLNWILGAAAVGLLFMALNESVASRQQGLEAFRAEVEKKQTDALAVEALKRQVKEAIVAGNFLADRKCQQPATIDVLAELTNLLPNHTWTERVTFFGKQVQLQGQSQQASELISLLGKAKTIDAPQFQGVIQPDPGTGKERFSLQANLVERGACP